MAISYDQSWPLGYADQKNYADYLLERAKILYARRVPITINKFIQPSQADWENAYVAETGLPLPIPVGVKMFWRSLTSGRVIQFGTINDSSNGTISTGTVFNLLNMEYTRPSLRLLATLDSSRHMFNTYQWSTQQPLIPAMSWLPSGSFVYGIQNSQIYYWMTRGLDSLMLIYRVRTADLLAAPPSTLQLMFNKGSAPEFFSVAPTGNNELESQYTKFAANVAVMATFGNPVATVAGTGVSISGTLNGSDSLANTFSYGQVWLHNVSQQLTGGSSPVAPRENYQNPMGYARTTYLGATAVDANAALSWGMFAKEDQGFSASNFFDLSLSFPVGGVGIHSAKVWAYGLFRNLTGEFRG